MNETSEQVRQWMSDWADRFDQSWDEDKLGAFIGENVVINRPELEDVDGEPVEARSFNFTVVGWSRDHLRDSDGNAVNRWSIVNSEAQQIPLQVGCTVEVNLGSS